jgi:putative ABC transport system permease protein
MILVFMLSFQLGVYDTMINTSVKVHAGHLQIMAKGYKEKPTMRRVILNPEKLGKILDHIDGIVAYTYRAESFSIVSSEAASGSRTYGVMVTGIDPDREGKVSTIKSLIRKGEYLSGDQANEALVGSLLAEKFKVKPGDALTILGQAMDGSVAATSVVVRGIFTSGIDAFDRDTIQIPLKTFQEVYSMGNAVHRIVIICKSLSTVDRIKSIINKKLAGMTDAKPMRVYDWTEIMPGLLQSIEMDLVSGLIMYAVLIIVVAFSILNTFLMAIFERTREFGVLMAIGTGPARIIKLLLIESISMTGIGIMLGMILGSLITLYFQHHGIDFTGASEIMNQMGISGLMYPRLSLVSISVGPLAVLFITSLAALYPALKVRKLKPVEALSYI